MRLFSAKYLVSHWTNFKETQNLITGCTSTTKWLLDTHKSSYNLASFTGIQLKFDMVVAESCPQHKLGAWHLKVYGPCTFLFIISNYFACFSTLLPNKWVGSTVFVLYRWWWAPKYTPPHHKKLLESRNHILHPSPSTAHLILTLRKTQELKTVWQDVRSL